MRAANLALRFLLELAALAGLADWGLHTGSGVGRGSCLAIAAVAAGAVVWGIWCAPEVGSGGCRSRAARSSRRPCSGWARWGSPPPGTHRPRSSSPSLAVANWVLLFAWRQDP